MGGKWVKRRRRKNENEKLARARWEHEAATRRAEPTEQHIFGFMRFLRSFLSMLLGSSRSSHREWKSGPKKKEALVTLEAENWFLKSATKSVFPSSSRRRESIFSLLLPLTDPSVASRPTIMRKGQMSWEAVTTTARLDGWARREKEPSQSDSVFGSIPHVNVWQSAIWCLMLSRSGPLSAAVSFGSEKGLGGHLSDCWIFQRGIAGKFIRASPSEKRA